MSYQILINPMPKNCIECPCVYVSDYQVCCQALAVDIYTDDVNIQHEHLPNCPLKPLILCKDCKFQDDDCDNCHRYDTDFYCKDGEAK